MFDNATMIWLILLIVFVVGEVFTTGLISIWFCFGALAAMIVSNFIENIAFQIIVFFVVSIVLLILTKPFVKRFLTQKVTRTNADKILDGKGIVIETINNLEGTGAIKVDGKIWTARSAHEEVVIDIGSEVSIEEIRGVKAIVNKLI